MAKLDTDVNDSAQCEKVALIAAVLRTEFDDRVIQIAEMQLKLATGEAAETWRTILNLLQR